MAVKAAPMMISLAAAVLLAAWLGIRLWMGLEAGMPAGWQLYRFAVAGVLMAPAAGLVWAQLKPELLTTTPRWWTGFVLAGASVVWVYLGGVASLMAGM